MIKNNKSSEIVTNLAPTNRHCIPTNFWYKMYHLVKLVLVSFPDLKMTKRMTMGIYHHNDV